MNTRKREMLYRRKLIEHYHKQWRRLIRALAVVWIITLVFTGITWIDPAFRPGSTAEDLKSQPIELVILAALAAFFRMVAVAFFFALLFKRLPHFRKLGEQRVAFRAKEPAFPYSRPPYRRCFLHADPDLVIEEYTQQLQHETQVFQKHRRATRNTQRKMLTFLQKLEVVIRELENVFGEQSPADIALELEITLRDDASLIERNNALARMQKYLSDGRLKDTHALDATPQLESRREILWRQVQELSSQVPEVSFERFRLFVELYERARKHEPTRIQKHIYYLDQAIGVATSPAEMETDNAEMAATETSPKHTVHFRTIRDLEQLLNLQGLVPPHISYQHVLAIIIWGLIHPGKRASLHINEQYRRENLLRDDVQTKLQDAYDPHAYSVALDWLLQIGVIMIPKHTTSGKVYSLNPHVADATKAGQPIVTEILSFIYRLRR